VVLLLINENQSSQICGRVATVSTNLDVTKYRRFVALHYQQIPWSLNSAAGYVALHCPQILQLQNTAGFVALSYPQIPQFAKYRRDLWHYIIRKSHGGTTLSANPAVAKSHRIYGTTLSANPAVTKCHRICGTSTLSANPAVVENHGICGTPLSANPAAAKYLGV
jgi:hypothetical protein